MRVNPGLQILNPSRGFEIEPGITLYASTFDALYSQIAAYRLHHGMDAGDPRRDVNDQFCAKWPHFCLAESGDGPTPEDQAKTMGRRVTAWAAIMTRDQPQGGYDLLGDDVAAKRSSTCRECPYNKPWKTNCAPCWAQTETLLTQLRRLRNVPLNQPIFGCEVDGACNRTAAFMPDAAVKSKMKDVNRYPPACWKKALTA